MLFFIFVGLVVLGVVVLAFTFNRCDLSDIIELFGIGSFIIGIIGVITSIGIIAANHIGVEGDIARMNTRYEHLVHQYDYNIYDNDNDLGKRELYEDIRAWNENIVSSREYQDDFWIGIYIPNIYDQFELIELSVG